MSSKCGDVEVEFDVPELGFAVSLGEIRVTECQMVNQFKGSLTDPNFAPLEGVQFHPESILTEHGHAMLGNFLKM